ncbi:MAG: hypothetical protein IJY34_01640 [Clostridia bacterium]|nr:hypothetical protein [Clostridia bacterium]
MGIFFSSRRLSEWSKKMKEAVDAASQFPPFGGNDVYFTTHELTDSIKIHGKVYYDPDAYVGSGWSQHKLTRQEAQDMFLDSVQTWVSMKCSDLEGPVPTIKGTFYVVKSHWKY